MLLSSNIATEATLEDVEIPKIFIFNF